MSMFVSHVSLDCMIMFIIVSPVAVEYLFMSMPMSMVRFVSPVALAHLSWHAPGTVFVSPGQASVTWGS
jgi:hypothetical protein